ncbi:MAG: hypothetical protein IPP55_11600 [Anaerolineales bacterium]|nr:hypothetical protein [Anaerolineales bacterium]
MAVGCLVSTHVCKARLQGRDEFVPPSVINETDALQENANSSRYTGGSSKRQSRSLASEGGKQEATKKKSATLKYRQAAVNASQLMFLDEAQTRQIIDAQLRAAGWEADTVRLRYNKGTRPRTRQAFGDCGVPLCQRTADLWLFIGLMPVAAVDISV